MLGHHFLLHSTYLFRFCEPNFPISINRTLIFHKFIIQRRGSSLYLIFWWWFFGMWAIWTTNTGTPELINDGPLLLVLDLTIGHIHPGSNWILTIQIISLILAERTVIQPWEWWDRFSRMYWVNWNGSLGQNRIPHLYLCHGIIHLCLSNLISSSSGTEPNPIRYFWFRTFTHSLNRCPSPLLLHSSLLPHSFNSILLL